METCDLLYINKEESMRIIKDGMEAEQFKERVEFLKTIKLFEKINTNHL